MRRTNRFKNIAKIFHPSFFHGSKYLSSHSRCRRQKGLSLFTISCYTVFVINRQTQDFIKGVLLFMSKQTNSKTIKTSIGGQAVIEGVMMRGPKLTALSVRMPDQSISTETWDTPNSNKWYKKTPLIRGVFNFVESLTDGYKSLMKAAEKAGLDDEEEEPLSLIHI